MTTSNTPSSRLACDTSDRASLRALFPDGEGMIYGFHHCHYEEVDDALTRTGINVYDWTLGENCPKKLKARFWGRQIYQIESGETACSCKTGLVNMVLENYKSKKNRVPIVPIVFCIATPNNPYLLIPANIVSKTIGCPAEPNKLITHQELRRAYKLCYDPDVHPEIQEVAQQSFKFAKVKPIGAGENFQLTEIEAPWKSPDWDEAWAIRKKSSSPATNKHHNWRAEVNDFVHRQSRSSGPYSRSFVSRL